MIGSKLRRRRRQWSWTVCAGAGLVMIGVLFLQGRLGHRVWIAGGSSREGVRDLDVLIDARQTFRPGSTTASHPWLSNAFCSPARLGVFCPKDAQSCASTATILVDDQNTADRMNMDWRFGNAALGGGASAGRRAIATAMRAGRGFLLAPSFAIWTQDLRDILFMRTAGNATDRPGVQADVACDVAMGSWQSPFLGVRPTRAGRRFVDAALKCETAKAFIDSRKNGPAGHALVPLPHSDIQTPLFSPACLRDAATTTTSGVRVCSLENPSFQMSLNAFDKHGPAKTGLWPAAVVVDSYESARALQAHGLWSLSPDGTCPVEAPPQRPVHPTTSPRPPFSLRIRVLTMARPASLRRLMASLLAADYLGDQVTLEFVVDAPSDDAAGATAAAHAITVTMVSDFTWPHGPKLMDIAVKQRGLINQWLSWRPDWDDEACLVLEDDIQMAPTFYAWSKPRLAAYWAAAARNGDVTLASRLSAISLSLQNKVVGEVAGYQIYGHTNIRRLLADETPQAYLAQQVSSWAPILLPRPWRHFMNWWEHERAWLPTRRYLNASQTGPSPCLPGLASNQWWAKAPDTMWTVWWHRFATATGYVVLYQNPRTGPAQAVNHKEPGEHFKVKQSADNVLPGRLLGGPFSELSSADLPALATLPVYDLHMRPLGPAGASGLRALALRGDFVAHAPTFGGSCEWVGMTASQRKWLDCEEGTAVAVAGIGSQKKENQSKYRAASLSGKSQNT